MEDTFKRIYLNNEWKNDESVSGHGSSMAATEAIRRALPDIISRLEIDTMIDIPCGDFYWMSRTLPMIWDHRPVRYLGLDVVPELIEYNRRNFGLLPHHGIQVDFGVKDITQSPLPAVDLILVRDLLGHFSNADVRKALINLKASRAKYMLATTFPNHETSGDIKTGEWRPINLASLWGLPEPLEYINEGCTIPGFEDKSLGLWRLRHGEDR